MKPYFSQRVVLLLFGRGVQAIFGILSLKFAMLYLLPEDIGKYFIFLSLVAFISSAFISPIGLFSNNLVIGWKNAQTVRPNILRVLKSILIVVFIASLVSSYVAKLILGLGDNLLEIFFIMFFGGISNSLAGLLINTLNILGLIKFFVTFNSIHFFLAMIVPLVGVNFLHSSAEVWFWGRAIGQLLALIVVGMVFLKKFPEVREVDDVGSFYRRALSFCLPLLAIFIMLWIQGEGYKFLLKAELGLEVVGYILAGFAISSRVTSVFETLGQQIYIPTMYKMSAEGKAELGVIWSSYFEKIFVLSLAAFFLVFGLFRELLTYLGNDAYLNSIPYILLGAVIDLVRINISSYSQLYYIQQKTSKLITPTLISAIVLISILYINLNFGNELFSSNQTKVITGMGSAAIISFFTFHWFALKGVTFTFPLKRGLMSVVFFSPTILSMFTPLEGWSFLGILKTIVVILYIFMVCSYSLRSIDRKWSVKINKHSN